MGDTSIIGDIQKITPTCEYGIDVGLIVLPRHLERFEVNLDPVYQRDYVWTKLQQMKFVGAFIENPRSILPILLNFDGNNKTGAEVIDGKQRINAAMRWLNGDFAAKCPCGTEVHMSEMDEIDERVLGIGTTFRWNFYKLNQRQVMEFYLRLNHGGTVHTPDDLARVRHCLEELG